MWAEMGEFLAGVTQPGHSSAINTVAWLIDMYQRDEDSPSRSLRASTRESYDRSFKIVRADVGERRLDTVDARDLRRWHREWAIGDDEGGEPVHARRAYGCIQMLRIVAKYGKGLRIRACRDLSEILTETEFPVPRGRSEAMTADQVKAIVAAARTAGFASIARAVALQFCCGLRQKDVIGEWTREGAAGAKWGAGLLWGEHIRTDMTLRKPTSKSNFKEVAAFDLRLLPMVMAELGDIPTLSRIGPVILDERTGNAYRQREFARRFRTIARAAGVPDHIFNMDARAGAVTDAYNKGAGPTDAMDLATHTQLATSRRYSRDRQAATDRVAALRFGPRNEAGIDPSNKDRNRS
jgi:hypothetical protein